MYPAMKKEKDTVSIWIDPHGGKRDLMWKRLEAADGWRSASQVSTAFRPVSFAEVGARIEQKIAKAED